MCSSLYLFFVSHGVHRHQDISKKTLKFFWDYFFLFIVCCAYRANVLLEYLLGR